MKAEQEIRDKIEELFGKRNALPRFDRSPIENELSEKYLLQAIALQWALNIMEEWWG